jgi:hypothetical protein
VLCRGWCANARCSQCSEYAQWQVRQLAGGHWQLFTCLSSPCLPGCGVLNTPLLLLLPPLPLLQDAGPQWLRHAALLNVTPHMAEDHRSLSCSWRWHQLITSPSQQVCGAGLVWCNARREAQGAARDQPACLCLCKLCMAVCQDAVMV